METRVFRCLLKMGKARTVQKMPACAYGVACTRKGCVYTHPPRPSKAKQAAGAKVEVTKSGKVSFARG